MHSNGKIFRPSVPVVMSTINDIYQRVEYLYGEYYQYILLNELSFDENTRIELYCQFPNSGSNGGFFGVNGLSNGVSGTIYLNGVQMTNTIIGRYYKLVYDNTLGSVYFLSDNTYILNVSKTITPYIGSGKLCLFNYNNNGTVSANSGTKGRVSLLEIYQSNVLILRLLPCYRKLDNVAGFYDVINDVFYTNQGSGSFVVGPDCTEVLQ